jgi:hypothetical protein
MEKKQTVIGSFKTEDEAMRQVKELLNDGYMKDEITIFTNSDVGERLNNPEKVDIAEPDINGNDEDGKNEQSFWESIKDAFKVRDEDYYNEPNYTSEDDLLHDYREELAAGHLVVVVSNYHGRKNNDNNASNAPHIGSQDPAGVAEPDPSVDARTTAGASGTFAGFPEVPDEGGVSGMGDGGQPPQEPRSSEGVPPELEDTDGEADSDKLKEERLRNMDDNPNV